MSKTPYSPEEKKIIGSYPVWPSYAQVVTAMGRPEPLAEPKYNRPISPKENFRLLLSGKTPYWLPNLSMNNSEALHFRPRQIRDNYATYNIFDGGGAVEYEGLIIRSWFDLDWEFIPVAGGSTIHPGAPKIEDMNDWRDIISFPDLDEVDWKGMAEMNREYLGTDRWNVLAVLSGHWERLMSLMDVDGAAVALIDEDQKDALKEFFDEYTDFMIEMIRRIHEACPVDAVYVHDDWGHQNGPFFSKAVAREMLLPYKRRMIDACHEMGLFYEQHSCGRNEEWINMYIEAGVDLFCPQDINDFDAILEKTKGSRLVIGLPDIFFAPGTPEEEIRAAAATWFEKYKDSRVVTFFFIPNPVFTETVYELSRGYYQNME